MDKKRYGESARISPDIMAAARRVAKKERCGIRYVLDRILAKELLPQPKKI